MQDDIKINPAHGNELVTLHEKSEVDVGARLKTSRITVKEKFLKASRHTECVQEPL
jgi:hypothetical protein